MKNWVLKHLEEPFQMEPYWWSELNCGQPFIQITGDIEKPQLRLSWNIYKPHLKRNI
jgi:hypothetical protein